MSTQRYTFLVGFLIVICMTLGLILGRVCQLDHWPHTPACECKTCEPQKCEVTVIVKGEVTGAIDVQGKVCGNVTCNCAEPEAKPYIPPAGPVPSLPEPKPVKKTITGDIIGGKGAKAVCK